MRWAKEAGKHHLIITDDNLKYCKIRRRSLHKNDWQGKRNSSQISHDTNQSHNRNPEPGVVKHVLSNAFVKGGDKVAAWTCARCTNFRSREAVI